MTIEASLATPIRNLKATRPRGAPGTTRAAQPIKHSISGTRDERIRDSACRTPSGRRTLGAGGRRGRGERMTNYRRNPGPASPRTRVEWDNQGVGQPPFPPRFPALKTGEPMLSCNTSDDEPSGRRDDPGPHALIGAALAGDLATVEDLLARGADPNAHVGDGETSLHARSTPTPPSRRPCSGGSSPPGPTRTSWDGAAGPRSTWPRRRGRPRRPACSSTPGPRSIAGRRSTDGKPL